MKRIDVLGIKIDAMTTAQAEEKVVDFLEDKKSKHIICTPNAEIIMKALKNPDLTKVMNEKSSLNIADGIGPVWAAKFLSFHELKLPVLRELIILIEWMISLVLIPIWPKFFKKPIPERISGSDFVKNIAKLSQKKGKKIYLLGGGPTIAERAALTLQTEFIDLKIAGVDSSNFEEIDKIVYNINKSNADALLVAFGAPKQELWLAQNLRRTSCKIGIGVGGSFDFLAGIKKRSPLFIQRIGLEWLYRLFQEPSRASRQMALPAFAFLVLKSKLFYAK